MKTNGSSHASIAGAFSPGSASKLSEALKIAVHFLDSSGVSMDDELRDALARKIVADASGGDCNVVRLANDAIRYARQFERMRGRLLATSG